MAQINVLIDDDLKRRGEQLFSELGLSFSSAVSVFVSQALREQGLPFKITANKDRSLAMASEAVLAREWLTPEEDEAWADL